MNKEFTLWGRKEDEPTYMEQLIVGTKDKNKFEMAKIWAKENGYIIRESIIDLSVNDVNTMFRNSIR